MPVDLPVFDPLVSGARWRRVLARCVDGVTVLFIDLGLVIMGLAGVMRALTDELRPEPWGTVFAALVLHTVTWFVYEAAFTSLRGQTPGKDLLRLKVVSMSRGITPGWRRCVLRSAVYAAVRLMPGLTFSLVALLALGVPSGAGNRRRSVADWLAGTRVISYDADLVEGPVAAVNPRDFERRYGGRWWLSRHWRQTEVDATAKSSWRVRTGRTTVMPATKRSVDGMGEFE